MKELITFFESLGDDEDINSFPDPSKAFLQKALDEFKKTSNIALDIDKFKLIKTKGSDYEYMEEYLLPLVDILPPLTPELTKLIKPLALAIYLWSYPNSKTVFLLLMAYNRIEVKVLAMYDIVENRLESRIKSEA